MKKQERHARPLSGTITKRPNCKLRPELLLGLLLIFFLTLTIEVGLLSDLSETGGEDLSSQSLRKSFTIRHNDLTSRGSDGDQRNRKNQKECESKEKEHFLNHKAKIGTAGPFPYYPAIPLVAEDHNFKLFLNLRVDGDTKNTSMVTLHTRFPWANLMLWQEVGAIILKTLCDMPGQGMKNMFNTEAHPMRYFPVMDKEDGVAHQL